MVRLYISLRRFLLPDKHVSQNPVRKSIHGLNSEDAALSGNVQDILDGGNSVLLSVDGKLNVGERLPVAAILVDSSDGADDLVDILGRTNQQRGSTVDNGRAAENALVQIGRSNLNTVT